MGTLQVLTDKLSIGLSMACAIHCLLLPFMLVLIPGMTALQLDSEAFHLWMVMAVLPLSLYALTMGCRQHKHYRLLLLGGIGLVLLVVAVLLGEAMLGETGEKILTLFGASLIAVGHAWNFRLCRQHVECCCPQHQ